MAGESGVGAYVTEAAPDKLMSDCWGLVGAVLEYQPAVTLQIFRRCAHYFPYGGQPVRP